MIFEASMGGLQHLLPVGQTLCKHAVGQYVHINMFISICSCSMGWRGGLLPCGSAVVNVFREQGLGTSFIRPTVSEVSAHFLSSVRSLFKAFILIES